MPETSDAGPQLAPAQLAVCLTAPGDWLSAEAVAGRVGGDHRRPPADLIALTRAALTRAAFSRAGGHADGLDGALSTARTLAATLPAARPATQAAPGNGTR